VIKEIVYFIDQRISDDTAWKRRMSSTKINDSVKNKVDIGTIERKFHISIDNVLSHKNHSMGKDAGISQIIDSRLSSKMNEYAGEVKSSKEMRRLLKIYVRNELFDNENLPDIANRRFFPSLDTVRTHIVAARKKLKLSLIDQDHLIRKIEIWRKEVPKL